MLETILRLYTASQMGGASTPVPHLFGPPGCGKSSVVRDAADLLGVNMFTINVSRISPLDLEGVQMPDKNNKALQLLTAIYWTQLRDGDILLLDEFLRGFPEVYNGLLDILTSREVGGFKLPKVFIIAASNTTVAYDQALSDRLLHLPVPDPRKSKGEKHRIAERIIAETGLLPGLRDSPEMADLLKNVVLPMYTILDTQKGGKNLQAQSTVQEPHHMSIRKLIGMTLLREVHCPEMVTLIEENNRRAMAAKQSHYVVILDPAAAPHGYATEVQKLKKNMEDLTPLQARNLELNEQLLAMHAVKTEEVNDDDAIFTAAD